MPTFTNQELIDLLEKHPQIKGDLRDLLNGDPDQDTIVPFDLRKSSLRTVRVPLNGSARNVMQRLEDDNPLATNHIRINTTDYTFTLETIDSKDYIKIVKT